MSKRYISVALREQVMQDSHGRCGYCLSSQRFTGTNLVPDHLIPEAKGGLTIRKNLLMACRRCNEHKQSRSHAFDPVTRKSVPLFNPRFQLWALHFVWSQDGTRIIGTTAIGRATVDALNMNDETIVTTRAYWVGVGWHPPKD